MLSYGHIQPWRVNMRLPRKSSAKKTIQIRAVPADLWQQIRQACFDAEVHRNVWWIQAAREKLAKGKGE